MTLETEFILNRIPLNKEKCFFSKERQGDQKMNLEQSHVVSSGILLLVNGVGLFDLLVLSKDRFRWQTKISVWYRYHTTSQIMMKVSYVVALTILI